MQCTIYGIVVSPHAKSIWGVLHFHSTTATLKYVEHFVARDIMRRSLPEHQSRIAILIFREDHAIRQDQGILA